MGTMSIITVVDNDEGWYCRMVSSDRIDPEERIYELRLVEPPGDWESPTSTVKPASTRLKTTSHVCVLKSFLSFYKMRYVARRMGITELTLTESECEQLQQWCDGANPPRTCTLQDHAGMRPGVSNSESPVR